MGLEDSRPDEFTRRTGNFVAKPGMKPAAAKTRGMRIHRLEAEGRNPIGAVAGNNRLLLKLTPGSSAKSRPVLPVQH